MTNVLKLSQCGKVNDSSEYKQIASLDAVTKNEYQSRCIQHEEKKDVTKALNEIILKQLFF